MAQSTSALWMLTLVAAVSWTGCASSESDAVGSAEDDLTQCQGAKLDGNGRCRAANGRYAKKICCEVAAAPTERRNLEAYACPAEIADEGVAVAFFDADSTLRVSKSGSVTANNAEDVNVLPFAAHEMKALKEQGYLIAVVSNQGGVASGNTPFEVAEGALLFTIDQLTVLGAEIDYLDFADQKDEYRKPKTGMADGLDERLTEKCGASIDYERSFMVGDAGYKKNVDGPHPDGRDADDFSNSDRGFAENLGISFFEPNEFFGWRDFEVYNIHRQWELVDLLDAMAAEAETLRTSGENQERMELLLTEVEANRSVNGL